MKPTRIAALFCLLGAQILAGTAAAHDLFLKPDDFVMEAGVAVEIPFLNGTFLESEASFSSDRLRDLSVVSAAGRRPVDMGDFRAGEKASWVNFLPGEAGVHIIGASLKPREITLSAEDFNDYLAHDGIPDVLARRRASGATGDVLEIYEKHVKAVVRVGDETAGPFDATLGYPAEIVLLDNPYELAAGDEIRFRCLVDGKPAAGQFVLIGGEHDGGLVEERSTRSDENGEAGFRLDQPGKHYLRFIHMQPSDQEGVDYHSKWATLTFEILSP